MFARVSKWVNAPMGKTVACPNCLVRRVRQMIQPSPFVEEDEVRFRLKREVFPRPGVVECPNGCGFRVYG